MAEVPENTGRSSYEGGRGRARSARGRIRSRVGISEIASACLKKVRELFVAAVREGGGGSY